MKALDPTGCWESTVWHREVLAVEAGFSHLRLMGQHKESSLGLVLLNGPAGFSCSGFPGGSVVDNPPANAGDTGSIPGPGRSPGGGNLNPLQCSCLQNPTDREAWQAAVHGVAESQTRLKQLSTRVPGTELTALSPNNSGIQSRS